MLLEVRQGRAHAPLPRHVELCCVALRWRWRCRRALQVGKFWEDSFIGPLLGCDAEAAHAAALKTGVAAQRARSFKVRGGGDGGVGSGHAQDPTATAGTETSVPPVVVG